MVSSSFFRLFVTSSIDSEGQTISPSKEQQHYLLNVLRLKSGDKVLIFNSKQGEWLARIESISKKKCSLTLVEQTRKQQQESGVAEPDIHYLFAPIKRTRLDYMVQKATEMGVSHLRPVITDYTNISKIKQTRMAANVIEAAEQCGILRVPVVEEPIKLSVLLEIWEQEEGAGRRIIFCDEGAASSSPIQQLSGLRRHDPLAVLIGPEGGFSPDERQSLLEKNYVTPISLGSRIMRADTAAVAALSLVNACLGDWV